MTADRPLIQALLPLCFALITSIELLSLIDLAGAPEVIAYLILSLLSMRHPVAGLCLFLFILPIWGGHYAAMPQMTFFLGLLAALVGGLSWRWAYHQLHHPDPIRLHLNHPMALALTVLVASGLLSLTSLPIDEIISRFGYLEIHAEPHFVGIQEVWVLYPLLKALILLETYFLYLFLINCPPAFHLRIERLLFALLGGVLATLVAGLLDYYEVINLRTLRPLEGWVNPNDIQQRLQSFFGHSAWCAQYLTMAIPSVLVLLTVAIPRRLQLALLVLILITGEYVLVLTFQRGGWVSYPLTLLVIWFCIYVLSPGNQGVSMLNSLKDSFWKIVVSVPSTLLVSLLLFTLIQGDLPSKYIERLKAISSVGERAMYIPVALKLTLQHPILGGGMDSFAYRYMSDFLVPSGVYFGDPKPLAQFYNNAHNAYLRTLQGQGLVGLLALAGLLVGSIFWILRLAAQQFIHQASQTALSYRQKMVAMMTFSSLMAFLIYGAVDDFFYVPSLLIVLFFFLALCIREVPLNTQISQKQKHLILKGFLVLAVAHLFFEYGYPGTTRKIQMPAEEAGCYPEETLPPPEARKILWCRDHFRMMLPVGQVDGKPYAFLKAYALPPNRADGRVRVEVIPKGRAHRTLTLPPEGPNWLIIPLEAPWQDENPVELEFRTDNGLIPLEDPRQLSLDRRNLALMIQPPLENPFEHLLDHPPSCLPETNFEENWHGFWCTEGGRLAPETLKGDVSIRVAGAEPSNEDPVWLMIRQNGDPPKLVEVKDQDWHRLSSFGWDPLRGPIGVEVSRGVAGLKDSTGAPSKTLRFAIGTRSGE